MRKKYPELTDVQLEQLESLFKAGCGERKIAKIMDIERSQVLCGYRKLKLSVEDHNAVIGSSAKDRSNGTLCQGCEQVYPIEHFRKHERAYPSGNVGVWYSPLCVMCEKEYSKQLNAKPQSKEKRKLYRQENKEELNQAIKDRKSEDPSFRLRSVVSQAIYMGLKRNGGSKQGNSIGQYLLYTMDELRAHIERLFEPWMTWDNWGNYDPKTWDDDDPSTWKWQIDHIVPHSTFNYVSMEDQSFRECWSLSNLRPYSAKLNALEGGLQTRHKVA